MKIGLDCGHTLSGADIGAEGCGRKEQNCTREIGYVLKSKLEALGHTVVICSKDSCSSLDDSLCYRVSRANNAGVDLYVAIHLNASDGSGHGTEVFTYGGKELSYARNVLNNIVALGFSNRGIKEANLYVINHTSMPSMLIECCFIDNSGDMSKYDPEAFANAIVKGITGSTSNATAASQPVQAVNSNNWIARLQSECNNQGFSNQAVDGINGPNTLAGCPELEIGCQGNITKLMQEKLVSLGYDTNGIDGIFGNGTLKAVMAFQGCCGLSMDGIVGSKTWGALLCR